MDPRTFPTKGNLILAKNSLALANQGYELMDKKRNIPVSYTHLVGCQHTIVAGKKFFGSQSSSCMACFRPWI